MINKKYTYVISIYTKKICKTGLDCERSSLQRTEIRPKQYLFEYFILSNYPVLLFGIIIKFYSLLSYVFCQFRMDKEFIQCR